MINMAIDEREVYYCLYNSDESKYGGEHLPLYQTAVAFDANVSPAVGSVEIQPYGTVTNYTRTIITHQTDLPIDENTVFFIDKEPEYDDDGNPIYDYIVSNLSLSANVLNITVKKVNVS